MGRAVRQFEKEVIFKLGTEVGYVTSNCMGRAVRQFEKEVSFKLGKGEVLCHSVDSFKKACDRLALQKMATAVSVESRTQNQASKVTLLKYYQSDSNNLIKSSSKNQLKFKNLTHQCSPLFVCNVTELTLEEWSFELSENDANFGFLKTIYVSPIII